uniref:Uncharacterized protein n=1 Tax=Anguilla anguilla TaxID=7936 RepID=A0A0E9TXV2_ANGAN
MIVHRTAYGAFTVQGIL